VKQLSEMLGGAGRDAVMEEGRSLTLDAAVSLARTGPAG
jgi:hypothetical protein